MKTALNNTSRPSGMTDRGKGKLPAPDEQITAEEEVTMEGEDRRRWKKMAEDDIQRFTPSWLPRKLRFSVTWVETQFRTI